MKTLFIIILAILMHINLFSQRNYFFKEVINKDNSTKFGIFGHYNFNLHDADFRSLQNCLTCGRTKYSSKVGAGFTLGLLSEFPLNFISNNLLLGLRASYYDNSSIKFTKDEPETLYDYYHDKEMAGLFKHSLNISLSSIGIEPTISYNLNDRLFLYAGFSVSFSDNKKDFNYRESLEEPKWGYFENDKREHMQQEGKINTINPRYSILAGLGYEIPLNQRKTFILSPEIFASYGLSNIEDFPNNEKWKIHSLRAGISLKWTHPKYIEDSCVTIVKKYKNNCFDFEYCDTIPTFNKDGDSIKVRIKLMDNNLQFTDNRRNLLPENKHYLRFVMDNDVITTNEFTEDCNQSIKTPVNVMFMLDISTSMWIRTISDSVKKYRIDLAKEFIYNFLKKTDSLALDDVSLLTFHENSTFMHWTNDFQYFESYVKKLEYTEKGRYTSLYEAFYKADEIISNYKHPNTIIILLTDGFCTKGKHYEELLFKTLFKTKKVKLFFLKMAVVPTPEDRASMERWGETHEVQEQKIKNLTISVNGDYFLTKDTVIFLSYITKLINKINNENCCEYTIPFKRTNKPFVDIELRFIPNGVIEPEVVLKKRLYFK